MEKLALFSIYDSKLEGYSSPFAAPNKAVAIRQFETHVAQDQNLYEHNEDYSLWHVGQFDPTKGTVAGAMPEVVVQAHQIVNKMKNQELISGAQSSE